MDAVDRYCQASEARDIDALVETLADDARLVSPISGHMVFRGREDLRILLGAVYRDALSDLRWTTRVGEGRDHVVMADARVVGVKMTDAMVFELAEDGRIQTIRPHLRPWLALTLFALVLGPRILLRPGVVRRALTR